MIARSLPRLSHFRRYLPAQYLLPIALLLALALGGLFGMLFHLTDVQDRMEIEQEAELVGNAVEGAKRLSDHDLRDYAQWDEAVVHLVHRFDQSWVDDNLGPYLGKTQGYDYVFVLDGQDRTQYGFHNGVDDKRLNPKALLGPALTQSLAEVRNQPLSQATLISGFSRAGDSVYLFSVGSVVPLTGKVTLPAGRTHAILIARKVDQSYLDRLAKEHNSPLTRLVTGGTPQGWTGMTLKASDGKAIGSLVWKPARPGSGLRKEILPAFVIVGLLSFFFAGVVLRRGSHAVEALRFSETRARHMARHDLLTGLPNRRALQDEMQMRLDAREPVSVLYLDLDGFKETNDVYGHGAGDELLRSVAARLLDAVPRYHLVARVGGDEFAILIAAGPADAMLVAQAILNAFATSFGVGGFKVTLGVSIGVVENEEPIGADELVRRADAAMYAAKADGKHCLRAYTPEIDSGRELRKELERDLRIAVENDEIAVVFQPIVSAETRQVCAVEALARWQHGEHGEIPPDRFIPIAEESGLIVALGRRVLTAACIEARDWGVDLAVNLSPAQFWDRGLAGAISDVLAQTGFPADRLELEITEGYLLRRPEAAAAILSQLKHMGVRIALDDFGTGFASIGYLQRLGFDSIKIDRSFVAAAASHAKAADLVCAIVSMGEALDLQVTAEGVELEEQARLMRGAGCTRLQGWLFGRPMPGADMARWFAETRRIAV